MDTITAKQSACQTQVMPEQLFAALLRVRSSVYTPIWMLPTMICWRRRPASSGTCCRREGVTHDQQQEEAPLGPLVCHLVPSARPLTAWLSCFRQATRLQNILRSLAGCLHQMRGSSSAGCCKTQTWSSCSQRRMPLHLLATMADLC